MSGEKKAEWVPPISLADYPEVPPVGAFDPEVVFYVSGTGGYLIDAGEHYRSYGRKKPVEEGISRWMAWRHDADEKEARAEARQVLSNIEVCNAIDWAGSIAGHSRGIVKRGGRSLLILDGPELVIPEAGPCPVILNLIRQAFLEDEPRTIFTGWLADGLRAVMAGIHSPAPMLVLAGGVNAGKSLLAWIVSKVFGGRVGHPYTAWTGTVPWNDDLIAAECLLIDDSVASIDIRSRREFAARFKEAIFGAEIQMRKRYASAISVRPVWRVMVCCNDNPESLAIIPPIDEDLDDKVSILRVSPVTPPVDTSTPEGKGELQRMILAELPAFCHMLMAFKVPDHLSNPRTGVMAWRDIELAKTLDSITPHRRLEQMLLLAFDRGVFDLEPGESDELPAADIEARLCDSSSPVRDQARSLLSKYDAATGRYLGRLAGSSDWVSKGKVSRGVQRWKITRPPELS